MTIDVTRVSVRFYFQSRGKLLTAAGTVGSSGAQLLQYMGEPEVDQQTQVSL